MNTKTFVVFFYFPSFKHLSAILYFFGMAKMATDKKNKVVENTECGMFLVLTYLTPLLMLFLLSL